jgi:hypothetical protein
MSGTNDAAYKGQASVVQLGCAARLCSSVVQLACAATCAATSATACASACAPTAAAS